MLIGLRQAGSYGQSDLAAGRIMNLIKSHRSKRHWQPAYLKPINTHPTPGEGQNGKLYGSGPDPFPPLRNKRERVGYARLGGGLETDRAVLVQYLLAIHSCAVVFASCQKSGSCVSVILLSTI